MTTCIFCGEPFGPQRPRSKEHAAPEWCRKLLPDLGPAQHTFIIETADGREELDHGERDPFTTVCGDVCRACNNGWMHELEESTEALLSRMIQGGSRNVRYWRQTLAATWAVKTAMVWDAVSPKDRTIPLDVLRSFHRMQRLNLRQQVWTGRYVGTQPHHSFRRTAAHVVGPVSGGSDDPQDAHAYVVALTVGQLAFVVFGHVLAVPFNFSLPEQIAPRLEPIWPPTHEVVKWPPSDAVDDTALEDLVRSLGFSIS